MTDMRQKLLPVFLEESGRMLHQLDTFFATAGGEERVLDDLETAFRSAHTLKGTAALVQADAVCALSGRIEGLLEGHYEKLRFPSEVEYEALRLAMERLRQLIAAIRQGQPEPAGAFAEADLALRLATAMPGRRPLSELLADKTQADPFGEDPEVDEDIPAGTSAADLFADAPLREPEESLLQKPSPQDPFAEDPAPDAEAPAACDLEPRALLPDDPFAEDPGLSEEETPLADYDQAAEPITQKVADQTEDPESKPEPTAAESYAEKMRRRLESESAIGTAERLASTLSTQQEKGELESSFRCCCFTSGGKSYYLPIADMVEIADLPSIVRLPLAPPVVRGLVSLRGKVMPVIDLSAQAATPTSFVAIKKLVVAEAGSERLAFLAEGIPDLAVEFHGDKVDVVSFVQQFRAGAT